MCKLLFILLLSLYFRQVTRHLMVAEEEICVRTPLYLTLALYSPQMTRHLMVTRRRIMCANSSSPSSCHLLSADDKTLDGYQKKKYVCELLFTFLLSLYFPQVTRHLMVAEEEICVQTPLYLTLALYYPQVTRLLMVTRKRNMFANSSSSSSWATTLTLVTWRRSTCSAPTSILRNRL